MKRALIILACVALGCGSFALAVWISDLRETRATEAREKLIRQEVKKIIDQSLQENRK